MMPENSALESNPAIVSVVSDSFITTLDLDYDGDGEADHIVEIEFDDDYTGTAC